MINDFNNLSIRYKKKKKEHDAIIYICELSIIIN